MRLRFNDNDKILPTREDMRTQSKKARLNDKAKAMSFREVDHNENKHEKKQWE